MIFVTVGTQLPFDRLVATVDEWAGRHHPPPEVLAQVGSGRMDFGNVRCVRTLDAVQYEQQIARTRLLVAHAGTGSILAAIERGIPVVILPRDPKRREHRDDHQIQTATKLDEMKIVDVAWSEAQLCELIEKNLSQVAGRRQGRRGGEELIGYIRDYLRTVLGPPLSPSTRCRASSRDT